MNPVPGLAYQERADLYRYTADNASALSSESVLTEAREYGYKEDYIYRSIGQLAHHLAQVGEEVTALKLADTLLDAVDADEDGRLLTWSSMAENEAKIAEPRLRQSMELARSEEGNTIVPEHIELHDGRTFYGLLSLYKFGDESVAPYLRQHVETLDDQYLTIGPRLAVKIYEAGDESAYEVVKTSAEKARSYVLAKQPDDKELVAEEASDTSQVIQGIARSLTPARSELESAYAQTDIALRYFAASMLEKGDVKKADELQALMLSGFDNAWLCAKRFELGHDPEGTYAQAAKVYLAVFGEDSGKHIFEITDTLVRGGDPDIIREYEFVYDSSVEPDDIDSHTTAKALVALHLSGDTRAHARLLESVNNPEDSWILISSLEDMGLKDEAIAAAKKVFEDQPNYKTGLMLLNQQYNAAAMAAVQNGASEFDQTLIDVVYSRSRHLGKLAAHIVEIERK